MSTRRSRRLDAPVKNSSTDTPTNEAVSAPTVSNESQKDSPKSLAAEKPHLEYYQVEDRIKLGTETMQTTESAREKAAAEKSTQSQKVAAEGGSEGNCEAEGDQSDCIPPKYATTKLTDHEKSAKESSIVVTCADKEGQSPSKEAESDTQQKDAEHQSFDINSSNIGEEGKNQDQKAMHPIENTSDQYERAQQPGRTAISTEAKGNGVTITAPLTPRTEEISMKPSVEVCARENQMITTGDKTDVDQPNAAPEAMNTITGESDEAEGKKEAPRQNSPSLEAKKSGEASVAASLERGAVHPIRRYRTRSTSSAVSSISGDVDPSESTNYFDNDGKTPLIANRRPKRSSSISSVHSKGPAKKRHKGRALFGDSAVPNNSVDPSFFHDGLLNNNESEDILATLSRSRSNTIDSFRAAMESSMFTELSSESLVLPEMKTNHLPLSIETRSRSDTIDFLSQCNLATPRARSDTIDFLTDAVGGDLDNDTNDELSSPLSPIKISENSASELEKDATAESNVPIHGESDVHKGKGGVAFGRTPKKNNLSGESVRHHHDPIKKRYRTRSLSYASACPSKEDRDEDDAETASICSAARMRSNTAESFQNAILGRSRSDTIDFLTAAVAGDYGHDLDAAIAAAAADGACFAMHPISAPSGASLSHAAYQPPTRSRSNTLDSTTSSINSSKLDLLISVAVEEGGALGLHTEEGIHDRTESTGEESSDQGQQRRRSNTLEIYSSMAPPGRSRSDTMDFLMGASDEPVGNIDHVVTVPDDPTSSGCVLEHLKALCDEPIINSGHKTTGILRRSRLSSGAGEAASTTVISPRAKFDDGSTRRNRANSDHTSKTNSNSLGSSSHRLIKEALEHFEGNQRSRNDSWGAMSDLSVTGITATHDALKSTGIIDDLMAAAADLGDDDLSEEPDEQTQRKRTGSGGTNSLSGKGRPRVDSLASLSLASLSDASISVSGRKEQYASELLQKKKPPEDSKTTAPTPGSQSIVVDYDAIAAAVNAANAATEGLDLNSILSPSVHSASKPLANANRMPKSSSVKLGVPTNKVPLKPMPTAAGRKATPKFTKTPPGTKLMTPNTKGPMPQLAARLMPKPGTSAKPGAVRNYSTPNSVAPRYIPANSAHRPLVKGMPPMLALPNSADPKDPKLKPLPPVPSSIDIPIPKSTKTEAEMEAIRERARAAAGYVPPPPGSMTYKPGSVPYKGPPRKPPYHPMPPLPHPNMKRIHGGPSFVPSMSHLPRQPQSRASTLQSQQKWDDMFEYLVKFIEDTRSEETRGMTEEEKSAWVWDGNVPTNYKTKCGKALGRWINNQRSAKTKGTLKDDREVRLVSTGLKWSVLTTNSWNEMLRELELYAEEKRQDGKVWDGNVPTNYKITVERACGGRKTEEEKNLGRWVNRQRSLYQAGKLKKERQIDLERVGLKWSVLLTASWQTMFECLCNYAKERRTENNGLWDGNVPTNHKVDTRPPVNLGRWINRQRCAYAKGRLKQEFVTKLDQTGLKWSMHDQKRSGLDSDDDDDFEGEEFLPKNGALTPQHVNSSDALRPSTVRAASVAPAGTTVSAAGVRTVPAPGARSAPAAGVKTTPAAGVRSGPAPGVVQTTPAPGARTTSAPVVKMTPVTVDRSVPAPGVRWTPAHRVPVPAVRTTVSPGGAAPAAPSPAVRTTPAAPTPAARTTPVAPKHVVRAPAAPTPAVRTTSAAPTHVVRKTPAAPTPGVVRTTSAAPTPGVVRTPAAPAPAIRTASAAPTHVVRKTPAAPTPGVVRTTSAAPTPRLVRTPAAPTPAVRTTSATPTHVVRKTPAAPTPGVVRTTSAAPTPGVVRTTLAGPAAGARTTSAAPAAGARITLGAPASEVKTAPAAFVRTAAAAAPTPGVRTSTAPALRATAAATASKSCTTSAEGKEKVIASTPVPSKAEV